MRFLIVTGLSGAGKTSILRHLEDNGYQCMDNIPPLLLAPAFTLRKKTGQLGQALVSDVELLELFLAHTSRWASIPAAVRCSTRKPSSTPSTRAATVTTSPSSFWRRTQKRSSTAIRKLGGIIR